MLSRVVNRILRFSGFEIRRRQSNFLSLLLERNGVEEIFDVGANRGQYGMRCRGAGYTGKIFSFEPLKKENSDLQAKTHSDPLWTAIFPIALGSDIELSTINISNNSVSSSLLPMSQEHLNLESNSRYVDSQETLVEVFDFYYDSCHEAGKTALLKLDIQGYEYFVLRGATNALKSLKFIQIELSLTELYSEGSLFTTVHTFLEDHGFKLVDVILGVRSPVNLELAQMDGIYMKVEKTHG